MTEPLTRERFPTLVDAYGAAIARWPIDVHEAALALASEPEARAMLDEAAALDAALDRWTVAAPNATLRERVMPATAPAPRAWRRARLWWSGIGIATALAGAAAGSVAAAVVAPAGAPDENATAFGELGGQGG